MNPKPGRARKLTAGESLCHSWLRSDLNVAPWRDFGKRKQWAADEAARENVLDRLSITTGMEHTG